MDEFENIEKIEKVVNLEELFEIIKNTKEESEVEPNLSITFTPDGYFTVFQRVSTFGYVIGVPGIGKMPAIMFTHLTDIDIDDLDELFQITAEQLDEEYNPDKLYLIQYKEK